MQNLAGKVALVTGASSGIGEGAALALAAAGVKVAVSARRKDRLDDLVKRIQEAGGTAVALPGDVTDEAAAFAAVADTIKAFGKLDILVNSAGIMQTGMVDGANLDEYRKVMDVNLMATVYTCAAAVPHMKAQGSGDIINISSLAGTKTGPAVNAYAASKHALNAMTDGMRQEVGGFGIRCTILMPGATRTEVADHVSDPNMRTMLQAHVGKEGAVLPSEMGDAVVFICSLPQRVNVSVIAIRPTMDTSA